MDITAN